MTDGGILFWILFVVGVIALHYFDSGHTSPPASGCAYASYMDCGD